MSDPSKFRPAGPGEVVLRCDHLAPTLDFFVRDLGFRVESIFPAEAPRVATLSGHGLRLRFAPGQGDPGLIRLPCEAPPMGDRVVAAPNGTRIEFAPAWEPVATPAFAPAFLVTRETAGESAAPGRAGMLYRDLIPGRLGGRFIASHIAIPGGGPVADWVHFHEIAFQVIFCRRGSARLVYEDQGPPFVFAAGDCILQPPRIRHRVLEASPGFEVVEVSCPAEHMTLADHDMALPNERIDPGRDFSGQVFRHDLAAGASWRASGGFAWRDTGLTLASGGAVGVDVARGEAGARLDMGGHGCELRLGVLLAGSAALGDQALAGADAFVIPPGEARRFAAGSRGVELMLVTSPAQPSPISA